MLGQDSPKTHGALFVLHSVVLAQLKTRITGLIIEELSEIGADGQANGPERFFRTPTEENTIYQSQNRVSFDDLCDWFSIEQERRNEERKELRAS